MWRHLTALFRSSPPAPTPAPVGVLVLYGLAEAAAAPDPQTPSLVLPSLDAEDAERCFAPTTALQREGRVDFEARLDAVGADTLRDPNSRARLGFVRRWLDEVSPAAVAWLLEPAETAGDGAHWAQ